MQNWPADQIHKKSVKSLIPQANNARKHSERQVEQIAASINEWGWTVPILVDTGGNIIAGHGRVMAANNLGIENVPCMIAKGWSEDQKRAYVIADNKLTINGEWDEDILAAELKAIGEAGFDIGLTGFEGSELDDLWNEKTEGLTDPDDVPEATEEHVTVRGDVWILGNHRLICGDSTDADTVAKLLNGTKPHLMVTDPPYGVEYDPEWRNKVSRPNGGVYASMATGKVKNDDQMEWAEAWSLFPGDVAYVWHGFQQCPVLAHELSDCGFNLRALIAWVKDTAPISRGDYHHQHETCWYAVKKTGKGHWSGDRKQTTVWHIDKPRKSETGHSTQKPVECMRRPIVNNSKPGDAVYEPFCGSGTTIIAGEMEGRHVYAIELSEAYCDVIVRRWQEFTGQAATLESDNRPFDEIALERAKEAA